MEVQTHKMSLFHYTWPIFIELLLQMLVGNVDQMMMSQVSQNAVAAIGNANQIVNVLIITFSVISLAMTILVTQYFGSGNRERVGETYSLALFVNFVFGLGISVTLVFFNRPIFAWMHVPAQILTDCAIYITIIGLGMVLQALFMTYVAMFRTQGWMKQTMAVSAVMILLLRDRKNTSEHELQQMEREETAVQGRSDLILKQVAWVLLPFIFLFAIYVLLNGETSPGGGFSGGTILGAGMILFSAAFGPGYTRVLMNQRRYSAVRTFGLLLYAVLYGVYIFIGANGLPNYLTGMILLIDLAVGLVVACTVYGFYALFSRGEI